MEARETTLAWLGAALLPEDLLGYRSYLYRSDGLDRGHQVVALYGHSEMDLRALFVGRLVGNLRTGAAVAAALHLAEPDLTEVGLIGTGYQARNSLTCLAAIFRLATVTAWSPDAGRRRAFQRWAREALGIEVDLAPDARGVLRASATVALLTSAEETVVTSDMARTPGLLLSISAYRRPEIDPRLLDAAPCVWTDSVPQAGSAGTLFDREDRRSKLRPLYAGVEDGTLHGSGATRIIVNTGAAWQEVAVAQALLESAEARGTGLSLDLPTAAGESAVF